MLAVVLWRAYVEIKSEVLFQRHALVIYSELLAVNTKNHSYRRKEPGDRDLQDLTYEVKARIFKNRIKMQVCCWNGERLESTMSKCL